MSAGSSRLPQAGEPALTALDRGDFPARDQQAPDVGGHLDRLDKHRPQPRSVHGEQYHRDGAAERRRTGR
jgi:hypothetical protein